PALLPPAAPSAAAPAARCRHPAAAAHERRDAAPSGERAGPLSSEGAHIPRRRAVSSAVAAYAGAGGAARGIGSARWFPLGGRGGGVCEASTTVGVGSARERRAALRGAPAYSRFSRP